MVHRSVLGIQVRAFIPLHFPGFMIQRLKACSLGYGISGSCFGGSVFLDSELRVTSSGPRQSDATTLGILLIFGTL